jgi:rod shape-determining protein MreB
VGIIREKIAIDLGTTYSIVAHESASELIRIPSSIALDKVTRDPVAYGEDAKIMFGKGSTHYEVVRPLRDGVICDFEAAGLYLEYLVHKARRNPLALHTMVLVCVPWGATATETRSYIDRVRNFRTGVRIIREPFAAALGCGVDVFRPEGLTLVDIGGGTVEVSTIAHGHMIHCSSTKNAGNAMDQTICERMLRQDYFEIGLNTAEAIKMKHGTVDIPEQDYEFEVMGLDRRTRSPARMMMSTHRLREFIEPMATAIEMQIQTHLEHLPPDLQDSVKKDGLWMVGGGAQLCGWPARLKRHLNLKVHVAEEPQLALIRGMREVLRHPRKYSKLIKISEQFSLNRS